MAKRYNLKSEIQRMKAKHQPWELQLPEVPGDQPEGLSSEVAVEPKYREKVIKVTPPQLYPDNVLELTATGRVVEAAKILLSDDDYAHMVAAGGSASVFFAIANEAAGAEPGESSASSAS